MFPRAVALDVMTVTRPGRLRTLRGIGEKALQTVKLLAEGWSYEDAAPRLGIAESTTRQRITALGNDAGIHGASALVAAAVMCELIDPRELDFAPAERS